MPWDAEVSSALARAASPTSAFGGMLHVLNTVKAEYLESVRM